MPGYNSNPGGGQSPDDDMYSDGHSGAPKSNAEKETHADESETTLIPKSICPGMDFEPGDEVMLRVVRVHEGDLEVAYAPKEEGDKEEGGQGEEPAQASMPSGGGEMSSMME